MSQPKPTIFFIVVYREDQGGPQHKVLTSISGLTRFLESHDYEKEVRGFDAGPFDVFMVNTEALEVAEYDVSALRSMLPKWVTPKKKAAAAGRAK